MKKNYFATPTIALHYVTFENKRYFFTSKGRNPVFIVNSILIQKINNLTFSIV